MTDKSRRQFITVVGAGAAAVPLTALVSALPSRVLAAEMEMVDPEAAQAKALQVKMAVLARYSQAPT